MPHCVFVALGWPCCLVAIVAYVLRAAALLLFALCLQCCLAVAVGFGFAMLPRCFVCLVYHPALVARAAAACVWVPSPRHNSIQARPLGITRCAGALVLWVCRCASLLRELCRAQLWCFRAVCEPT